MKILLKKDFPIWLSVEPLLSDVNILRKLIGDVVERGKRGVK